MRTGSVVEWRKGVGTIRDDLCSAKVSVHWSVVDPRGGRDAETMLSVGDRVAYELAFGARGNAASRVWRLEE